VTVYIPLAALEHQSRTLSELGSLASGLNFLLSGRLLYMLYKAPQNVEEKCLWIDASLSDCPYVVRIVYCYCMDIIAAIILLLFSYRVVAMLPLINGLILHTKST